MKEAKLIERVHNSFEIKADETTICLYKTKALDHENKPVNRYRMTVHWSGFSLQDSDDQHFQDDEEAFDLLLSILHTDVDMVRTKLLDLDFEHLNPKPDKENRDEI